MNRQQVHKYFRRGQLILAELNDELFATDAYLIVPVDPAGPVANLLDFWNLTVEPGVYFVEDRVRRGDGKTPNISALMEKGSPAKRVEFRGRPLLIEPGFDSGAGDLCCVYEMPDGSQAVLREQQRKMVEAICGFGEWHGTEALKPMQYVNDTGQVRGVLMPIRVNLAAAEKAKTKRAAA